jgi:hypothetical protein
MNMQPSGCRGAASTVAALLGGAGQQDEELLSELLLLEELLLSELLLESQLLDEVSE